MNTHYTASAARSRRLFVGVVVLACSACQPPAASPVAPRIHMARPVAAQHICTAFTNRALSVDARTASSPTSARAAAARRYATPALARRLAHRGRDPEWELLRQRHARVTVTTTPVRDDPRPATAITATAGVEATRHAIPARGRQFRLPTIVVYCGLRRAHSDGPWKLTNLNMTATDLVLRP